MEEDRDEDDARARIYRLKPEPFGELRAWLVEVERFWSDQLDSFKQHAEGTRPPAGKSGGKSTGKAGDRQ